jgi:hypothetical protein
MRKAIVTACVLALFLALAGCANLVMIDTKVDGEITFEDENEHGSTPYTVDYLFYWDNYTFNFEEGVTYDIELWCPSGNPVWFNIGSQSWSFSVYYNDNDTYAIREYTAPISGNVDFSIYLRYDFIGSGVPYSFKISKA